MLLQLLEDIEILSHQQSEGTFADTVGDNEDGGWEKYLDDHTIRDDIIDFEVSLNLVMNKWCSLKGFTLQQ